MKKTLLSILAALYITASGGAVVHLHYCMDKLVGWALWHNDNGRDKCSKCGMDKGAKSKGCCKDEHKLVKINKDHKNDNNSYKLNQPVKNVFSCHIISETHLLANSLFERRPQSLAPPLTCLNDTYLLNRNFRI